MTKYIDAEKLKRFVGELKKQAKRNCYDSWGIVPDALEEVEGFIDSLQHEQPESICPRCIYRNKTDDTCEYPYGGRECRINENGVYECNGFEEVEQQEQPEVDLEKEIEKEWETLEKDYSPSALDKTHIIVSGLVGRKQFSRIARYFYEFDKNSK